MTVDEARAVLELIAGRRTGLTTATRNRDAARVILDALDAAERERDEALREMHARELHHFEEEQRAARLEAIIERAKAENETSWRRADVRAALDTAPADALRERDAEKWEEGARWAAVELEAVLHEDAEWLAPGDNPYRTEREGSDD